VVVFLLNEVRLWNRQLLSFEARFARARIAAEPLSLVLQKSVRSG